MSVLVNLSCDPHMRLVPCDRCGGDGGWQTPDTHWDITCPACDGTGEMLVEVEPVTLDDIEEMYRDC